MFIFNNPIRHITPEEQERLNRSFMIKQRAEYRNFCSRLLKSLDNELISIEHMDDEELTCGFSIVNILFEHTTDKGFYYNLRYKLTVYHLKNIGNPIYQIYRDFINSCKLQDLNRIN